MVGGASWADATCVQPRTTRTRTAAARRTKLSRMAARRGWVTGSRGMVDITCSVAVAADSAPMLDTLRASHYAEPCRCFIGSVRGHRLLRPSPASRLPRPLARRSRRTRTIATTRRARPFSTTPPPINRRPGRRGRRADALPRLPLGAFLPPAHRSTRPDHAGFGAGHHPSRRILHGCRRRPGRAAAASLSALVTGFSVNHSGFAPDFSVIRRSTMRVRRACVAIFAAASLCPAGPVLAQTADVQALQQEIEQLRKEFEAIQQQYGERLSAARGEARRSGRPCAGGAGGCAAAADCGGSSGGRGRWRSDGIAADLWHRVRGLEDLQPGYRGDRRLRRRGRQEHGESVPCARNARVRSRVPGGRRSVRARRLLSGGRR